MSADADGRTVVVGAPGALWDSMRPHGAAYVFVRPAGGWSGAGSFQTETAKLTTSDGHGNDSLGVSVDVSADGSTIVAGTFRRESDPAAGPSAAYFFAKPAGGWSTSTEDAKVVASNPGEWFGYSSGLSGNGAVAVVAAPLATVNSNPWQGAVHVFTGSSVPSASVSPSSLAFGPQPLGTTSAPQTVTVTNSGTAPLHVSSVGVTGRFTSTQNCVSASPIAPGGSCSENVAFAPVSLGPAAGTLSFTNDSGGASGAVQQVPLQGSGSSPSPCPQSLG